MAGWTAAQSGSHGRACDEPVSKGNKPAALARPLKLNSIKRYVPSSGQKALSGSVASSLAPATLLCGSLNPGVMLDPDTPITINSRHLDQEATHE